MSLRQTGLGVAAAMLMMTGSTAFAAVDATASLALAKNKACMACHAVDKKLVGPAFKDVAAKYKGDKTAVAKLSEKVIKGGGGVWGPVPMPPNAVTPAEAKSLTEWILSH